MNKEQAEYYLNHQLGPDDTFRFKCRGCGKCCKNREDVILSSEDVFHIAKKLNMTTAAVIDEYCDLYIGQSSCVPIVRIMPRGVNRACPFLEGKRCKVHDAKPVVCALYPLGRIFSAETPGEALLPGTPKKASYTLNPVDCGSIKKQHTVRSWLAQFGIPLEDPFYIAWNEMLLYVSPFMRQLEEAGTSEKLMNLLRDIIYQSLFKNYDTEKEFLPQFQENTTKLMRALGGLFALEAGLIE